MAVLITSHFIYTCKKACDTSLVVSLFHFCLLCENTNDSAESRRSEVQSKMCRAKGGLLENQHHCTSLNRFIYIYIYNEYMFISVLRKDVIPSLPIPFSATEFLHRFIQHWWWWHWFPFCSRSTKSSSFSWTVLEKAAFVIIVFVFIFA